MALSWFFVKSSDFGQRIMHFHHDFGRSGGDLCWCMEIVRFCVINAMKPIDKHSFLRKVDCEIY